MERITHRKLETKISLRFQDSSRVSDVISKVRMNLQDVPKLDYTTQPFRVSFVGFGEYCLEIEILAYFATKSLDEFLYLQEIANIEILKAVYESGAKLALPTTQMIANVQQAPPIVVYAQNPNSKVSSGAQYWNPSEVMQNTSLADAHMTRSGDAEIAVRTDAQSSSNRLPTISQESDPSYDSLSTGNTSPSSPVRGYGMNMIFEGEGFWDKYDFDDDI